jgi:sugar phosphate permease
MGQRGRAQGITHAAARIGNAVAPAAIVAVMAVYGWRKSFYACAAASFLWVALWTLAYREFPKDHPRITALELASLPAFAATPSKVPWRRLLKRMAPVTAVYFCYGWTLWLFLSWIPQYFQHNQSLDLKRSALFASGVFFGGVLGDTLGGEMTIGPMWATPMDIAPGHSGTASGIMNSGSALAAIISPVVAGYVIDRTGNWQLPFVGSMILMGVGVLLAHRMRPDSKFDDGMQ